jgi:hypothetical protein
VGRVAGEQIRPADQHAHRSRLPGLRQRLAVLCDAAVVEIGMVDADLGVDLRVADLELALERGARAGGVAVDVQPYQVRDVDVRPAKPVLQ